MDKATRIRAQIAKQTQRVNDLDARIGRLMSQRADAEEYIAALTTKLEGTK